MSRLISPTFLFRSRRFFSPTTRTLAFATGPSPPRLPPKEQEEFERLQKSSTGAFSTAKPQQPNVTTNPTSSSSSSSSPQINQSPASRPDENVELMAINARVAATGKGAELHPDIRRGAKPEFEGEVNPKTGEVGGPKIEPLRSFMHFSHYSFGHCINDIFAPSSGPHMSSQPIHNNPIMRQISIESASLALSLIITCYNIIIGKETIAIVNPGLSMANKKVYLSIPIAFEKSSRSAISFVFSSLAHEELISSGITKFSIKREDSNCGLTCGGNKVRKLEYILSDAIKARATTLVATGGLQSNPMRQVAATAARYELNTHLISADRVKSEDPEFRKRGNIQITHLGATYTLNDSEVEQVLQSNGSPHRTLIGIDVFATDPGRCEKSVLDIAKPTARRMGLSDTETTNAGTYGFVNNFTRDAVKLLARLEGKISLETAKSSSSVFLQPPNTVHLLDVQMLKDTKFTTPGTSGQTLKSILEAPTTPKIFFDVRNDSDALYAHYGIALQGVQDIQLMENASRSYSKNFLAGLAKCIETTHL
ncbi:hypothetical protein B7494_g5478 [Chlorociboria aeruginascens]|nr:hypothetical protein B7494_g5478 [Chlorociboria aeruginascens]